MNSEPGGGLSGRPVRVPASRAGIGRGGTRLPLWQWAVMYLSGLPVIVVGVLVGERYSSIGVALAVTIPLAAIAGLALGLLVRAFNQRREQQRRLAPARSQGGKGA